MSAARASSPINRISTWSRSSRSSARTTSSGARTTRTRTASGRTRAAHSGRTWLGSRSGYRRRSRARTRLVSTTSSKGSMMTPSGLEIPSLKGKVSEEEWAVRVDLAACYRLLVRYGWEDLTFTHITVRVPGAEDQFLINPYGLFFDEITASSLVKIDLQGKKLDDSPYGVNPAGFVIHSAIHAARHDARCVLHTHTVSGIAVSAQREGLLPISQQSMPVIPSLGYHDFGGIATRGGAKPRLVPHHADHAPLRV